MTPTSVDGMERITTAMTANAQLVRLSSLDGMDLIRALLSQPRGATKDANKLSVVLRHLAMGLHFCQYL